MAEDPTEVLSLDELMTMASEPSSAPTVQIQRPVAPPPPVASTTTPAPAPLNPAAPKPTAHRAAAPQRPVASIRWGALLDQGEEKFTIASERVRGWLSTSDNGLIAATAAVALLLLVIVAAL